MANVNLCSCEVKAFGAESNFFLPKKFLERLLNYFTFSTDCGHCLANSCYAETLTEERAHLSNCAKMLRNSLKFGFSIESHSEKGQMNRIHYEHGATGMCNA